MGVETGLVERWFIQEWVKLNFGILMEKAAIAHNERDSPYWWNPVVYDPPYREIVRPADPARGMQLVGGDEGDRPGASDVPYDGFDPNHHAAAIQASLAEFENQERRALIAEQNREYEESVLRGLEERERKKREEQDKIDAEKLKRAPELLLEETPEQRLKREQDEAKSREEDNKRSTEALANRLLSENRADEGHQRQAEVVERENTLAKLKVVVISGQSNSVSYEYTFDLTTVYDHFKQGRDGEVLLNNAITKLLDSAKIGMDHQKREKSKRTGLMGPTKKAIEDDNLRKNINLKIRAQLQKLIPNSVKSIR
jgi:hypothetical protein